MDDRRNHFQQLGEIAERVVKRMRPLPKRPDIVEVPADDFEKMVELAKAGDAIPAEPTMPAAPCDEPGHLFGPADGKTGERRCMRCGATKNEKKERTRAE